MLIGYARVSTHDQTLALQRDALEKAGCTRIYEETISSTKADRPKLAEALAYAREGDVLVVWRLDRLGRSVPNLIEILNEIAAKGVGFKSLQESIDTTTPMGKLFFHLSAAFAQYERDLIQERTRAGLAAARARGRFGGRPRLAATDNPKLVARAKKLHESRELTIKEICDTLHISQTTLYRYLNGERKQQQNREEVKI
jgi:DNA invertase Pin-like site-specific DNA recombinase